MKVDRTKTVVEIAVAWWKSKRPVVWTEAQHLEYPTINCWGALECALARSAAVVVRERKETTS